ncbi:MAG: endonuclease III domain-containing protein [Candidatus Nanoarchaeia archaeon]
MNKKKAISQLKKIEEMIPDKKLRLAAEWKSRWKVLIATILSAQTRDEKTIEICKQLFKKYNSLEKLSKAPLKDIKQIIRPLNYYKTKAKHIKQTAHIVYKRYGGRIPKEIDKLLSLPGVGRKTANVYLVVAYNAPAIGVDTHVARISRKLGWTKHKNRHKIEQDLEELFPKKYYGQINWILVRFGRTIGKNRKKEDELLKKLK